MALGVIFCSEQQPGTGPTEPPLPVASPTVAVPVSPLVIAPPPGAANRDVNALMQALAPKPKEPPAPAPAPSPAADLPPVDLSVPIEQVVGPPPGPAPDITDVDAYKVLLNENAVRFVYKETTGVIHCFRRT